MRKTVLFAAALSAATAVTAQTGEITSNRGENWLSQDGDWGLTIDATPFIGYAGNLFNGTSGNTVPTWISASTWDPYNWAGGGDGGAFGSVTRAVIGVKKLKDANTAFRGRVRLGFYSHKETVLVSEIGATDPNAMVEDVTKTGGNTIQLGFGLEKRVGSTRVVGVYGADLNLGFAGQKKTFEYGNSLDNTGSRISEEKQGGAMMVGLNAFVGVEWFVAPKVSLGAEYGWGLMLASKGFNKTSWERVTGDNGPGEVESGTKVNDFGIDTNNNGVSINMNFYFQ
ncbi:MAG: hypothetical protein IT228_06530 [Flavobacteriales bacterium]|nr:hypothetical protein [Flavobacteriales bacterium]MCC6576981.1 hypothetical protein [Flavobacteriales bacterium]NUQ15391.1 hypothetical protein [Flavobacteriales bacterium]